MSCGGVTKSEGSDCLFLWLCQMFLWVPNGWHKAFSPEWDRMPCSCFCSQTHWELGLLPSAGALLHLWPCSLAFHLWDVLMLLFLFDSVLFMSSLVGGKGPSLPPVLHQPMWRLLAGSSTAVLEYIYSKGKPVRMGREALEDTSEERRKWARLSVGEGITWEKLRVLDKDWDTSGNKLMEECRK